jgi:hypothetical protein
LIRWEVYVEAERPHQIALANAYRFSRQQAVVSLTRKRKVASDCVPKAITARMQHDGRNRQPRRDRAMRPMVPAKDFDTSRQFYLDLGFQPRALADRLIEMQLGPFSFILQNHYAADWANNFVMHVRVTDVGRWWDHIRSLDLPSRYGVKTLAPKDESWGMVVGLSDPAGVLWRFAQPHPTRR